MPLHFPSAPAGRQPVKADLHAAAHAAAPAGASSLDPHSSSAQAAAQNAETCRKLRADADPAGETAVPNGLHTQLLVQACTRVAASALHPSTEGEQAPAAGSCCPCSRCCRHLRADADPAGGTTAAAHVVCSCMHPTHTQQRQQQPLRVPCASFAAAPGPSPEKGDGKHGPDTCTTPVHACTH